jgi:hypothetical protein
MVMRHLTRQPDMRYRSRDRAPRAQSNRELQKRELKQLKSLDRKQNCTLVVRALSACSAGGWAQTLSASRSPIAWLSGASPRARAPTRQRSPSRSSRTR